MINYGSNEEERRTFSLNFGRLPEQTKEIEFLQHLLYIFFIQLTFNKLHK